MKGYKVFNPNWTCRSLQYQVGESYEMDDKPIVCDRGFHFCIKASGCFNTSGQTITMFNKPCDWTMKDWWVSAAKFILSCMPETNESGERQEWWDAMADGDVKKILALPNFDADIFEECTGIRV